MTKSVFLTVALISVFSLGACGQKGPLYLEKDIKKGEPVPTQEVAPINQTIEQSETTK